MGLTQNPNPKFELIAQFSQERGICFSPYKRAIFKL